MSAVSTSTIASPRLTGVILVLVSATVFSSAGLFVKGVDADAWSIMFWRGLFAAAFTTGYICWQGTFRQEFGLMGKPGIAAAIIGALGTMAFIPAFKLTTIANVSLIYAAAPFVSAAVMWTWVREKPTPTILVSSLVAFGGVLLIVSGSIGSLHLTGDALALWMTVAMAGYLCIYRRFPDTPAAGPAVALSLILVPVGLLAGNPFEAPLHEILIMGGFGLVFALASVTLAEGARRLPAAETALLSALETPLAPLWAWLLFAEMPLQQTLIGGAVILAAVYGSQLFRVDENKN